MREKVRDSEEYMLFYMYQDCNTLNHNYLIGSDLYVGLVEKELGLSPISEVTFFAHSIDVAYLKC